MACRARLPPYAGARRMIEVDEIITPPRAAIALEQPSRAVQIVFWILCLPVLLVGIGTPPVSRTQEARVLETARQMLDRPAHDWLIPKINGELRLQKPPLTYWLSAVAYKLAGRVDEGIGRVP